MRDARDTLRTLYDAFAAHDGAAMAACYAPGATFEDPVFRLRDGEIGDMWRMLTERSEDLRVAYRIVDDRHVEWTADYTFGGREVHNVVSSEVDVDADGRITRQVDTFDFRTWARQALGWKGRVFGRFRFLQNATRRAAASRLASWQRRNRDHRA